MANYYWYTPLIPILGYHVQFNSHNNYVDIIAQTGIIGLACFFWFAFEVWRVGWGIREKVPDGFAKAYVIGALGGLVATLVSGMLGDWILPFVYNVGLQGFRSSLIGWLFLGGLIALEGMTQGKEGKAH
jgi:O-antigen ligase